MTKTILIVFSRHSVFLDILILCFVTS